MDSTEKSLDFCRICAQRSNQTHHLFETMHNGMALAEMLNYCLKRPITKECGLPLTICLACQEHLISTYKFHNLCESSEQFLLEKFAPNNVIDETIPQDDANEIKHEFEYKFSAVTVDESVDIVCKPEIAFRSELICVDEQFDANMIAEESPKGRLKSQQKSEDIKTFECYECKEQFDQLHELRTHIQDHNSSRKPFECTICNIRFMHLNSWVRHRSRHTKNVHNCEYCDQAFKTLTILKHHIQDEHKDRLNAYRCDQCTEVFSLNLLLLWHKERHKKAKQFVCTTCNTVFWNERKLKSHIRDNHASKCRKITLINSCNF